jgi:HD-GYP domain-containing protein (c-di-GMP phosphodiesterase class II)
MTTDTDSWEPIEAEQVQIGHYIKINHRWFDHPFVRRMFQITSEREIAIIRDVELSRMFVDHRRSTVAGAAPAVPDTPVAPVAPAPLPAEAAAAAAAPGEQGAAAEGAAAAAPEADAQAEKQAEQARINQQRESLAAARARDRVTHERGQALMAALNCADATGARLVDEFVDYLVAMLNNSTTPLALAASTAPQHSTKRYVLQSSDAVSLVAIIGKRMGLKAPQLRVLTQAAATHILGLARLPPHLLDEDPGAKDFSSAAFRNYPLLSATILEQCGGFSFDVLRIVREHREKPDGSGFPRALRGDAIHPHALILGAVRDFQIRSHGAHSPAVALAYMHRNFRTLYGPEIFGHLASALLVYPVGTFVQLSDGCVARVLSVNEAARMSPVVEVFEDSSTLRDWITLDLSQCPGLSIVRALDTSYLPPRMFETARRARSDGARPPKPAAVEASAEPPAEPPVAVSATG